MSVAYPVCRHGPLLQEKDRRIAMLEKRDMDMAERALRAEGEVLALKSQLQAEQLLRQRSEALIAAQRLTIAELQRALAELPRSMEDMLDIVRLPDAKSRAVAGEQASQRLDGYVGGLKPLPKEKPAAAVRGDSVSEAGDNVGHLSTDGALSEDWEGARPQPAPARPVIGNGMSISAGKAPGAGLAISRPMMTGGIGISKAPGGGVGVGVRPGPAVAKRPPPAAGGFVL